MGRLGGGLVGWMVGWLLLFVCFVLFLFSRTAPTESYHDVT